jgi:hypothetical protein
MDGFAGIGGGAARSKEGGAEGGGAKSAGIVVAGIGGAAR